MKINGLIWDDWNKKHVAEHGVTPEDVEGVCHNDNEDSESYRGRILIKGKNKYGKTLKVVLSDQDRNFKPYKNGIYYVITAYFA